ncbi:MAG: hypothetical protein QCH31_00165 [Methanolobus sp.]|nr:hypothetical protein [Methanolobus sp.]
MNSIEIFNFIDFAFRLCIVILSLFTVNLLIKIDADVIRSRIYVAFKNLKKYFIFLTFGFVLYLFEAFISVNSIPGSIQNDPLQGIMMMIFQLTVLVFLYNLYVAIRVPNKRIL